MNISASNFSGRSRVTGFMAGAMLLVLSVSFSLRADFQGSTHMLPFEEGVINYNSAPASNSVVTLQKNLDGKVKTLTFNPKFGYLQALLDELKIPQSSQMLVFSKTSFQRDFISPGSPRAIFFNDDVYVGFVPGAPVIEISVADPKLGAVFYTLEQTKVEAPKITRNNQCLECHASGKTVGVPGHLVRSFETDGNGVPDLTSGISMVNHRTPLDDRWGGWYVTGKHGGQLHRGNLIGKEAFDRQKSEPNFAGNITSLNRFFNPASHLKNQSDIVALMVLEHQAHMHNLLTRLAYESQIALATYGHIRYLKSPVEAFLKYLLFTEEIRLAAPVTGNAEFEKEFSLGAMRDKQGRSLRDLDLKTKLFKYPCSYLIYSEAFNSFPAPMKEEIYRRLWAILSGKDAKEPFANLSIETRHDILEILLETKNDLPDYWRKPSK